MNAIILGASGLVGSHLLDELLADPKFSRVTSLSRRHLSVTHPRLEQRIVDFEHLDNLILPAADAVFCCLGSTRKAAGSRAAFRRIDHDYVIDIAQRARAAGAKQFLLISSMGANAHSPFFYMRTKGELENNLRALGYPSASVFRPAYLVGVRSQSRPGEDAAGAFMQALAPITPAAFRPVPARAVARAMLNQAHHAPSGFHIIQSGEILASS
jgi:uncharacterized protein YbjT (DUF2867 family)